MSDANDQPTAPDGPTGQLAAWVAGFTLDQAPREVRDRAKHLLLDGLGCALIGAQLPWSRTAVDAVLAFEAPGDTPLIGWGAPQRPRRPRRFSTAPSSRASSSTTSTPSRRCTAPPLVIPALLSTAVRGGPRLGRRSSCTRPIAGFETGTTRRAGAARRRDALARLALRLGVRHPRRRGSSARCSA